MPVGLQVTVRMRSRALKSKAIEKDRFVIGRDPDCDLSLFNVGVSRHHAVVERGEEGYILRDLGSTNGTRIGERSIDTWRIEPGTTVCIHLYELSFTLADATTDRRSTRADVVAGFGDDGTMKFAER